MATQDDFRSDVEAFLARHDMKAATFGTQALKDPKFVFDLRNGRSPSLKTIDRVRQWMADYDAARSGEGAAAAPAGEPSSIQTPPDMSPAAEEEAVPPPQDAAAEADTEKKTATATATAAGPGARISRRRLWPVVLLFVVSLLVIGIGIAYVYRPDIIRAGTDRIAEWFSGDGTSAEAPVGDEMRQVELMALINAVQADYNILRGEVGRLGRRMDRLASRLSATGAGDTGAAPEVTDRMARLEAAVDSLSSRLAGRDLGAASRLGDQLVRLEERVAGIEDTVETLSTLSTDVTRAALTAVFVRLDTAVRGGESYGAVLSLFRERLAEGGPARSLQSGDALASLAAHANTGVATRASLAERFAALIPEVLGTSAAGDTWWDRLLNRGRGLVSIRKTGPVAGEDPAAIVARAEAALNAGDLAAAVDEMTRLAPERRAVVSDWIDAAKARLEAEAALNRLAADLAPAREAG